MDLNTPFGQLDDSGLFELASALDARRSELDMERQRRINAQHDAAVVAGVIADLQEQGVVEAPAAITLEQATGTLLEDIPAWVDPGTDKTKMYTHGAVVTNLGKAWLNEVQDRLNHWEPGGAGVWSNVWRDVTDQIMQSEGVSEAPVPDGTQEHPIPWRAGLTLVRGQHVTLEGAIYEVLSTHNSAEHWPPAHSPSLYKPA